MSGPPNRPPEHPGLTEPDDWAEFAAGEPEEHPVPARRASPLTVIAIVLGIVTLGAMVLLRPTGEARAGASDRLTLLGVPSDLHSAETLDATDGPCAAIPESTCRTVRFVLTGGPDEGATYTQEFSVGGLTPEFNPGDTVVLSYVPPNGIVTNVESGECEFDPTLSCRIVTLSIHDTDRIVTYEVAPGDPANLLLDGDPAMVTFFAGDNDEPVVLSVAEPDFDTQYQFADFQRRPVLLWVTLLFAVVVVALGGLRGVAALAGLAASIVILMLFVLPAILDGRSPVLVAVVGASAIAYLALYLAHGFRTMTTVALLGTLAALLLTALLSASVVAVANLTGFATEESTFLSLFGTIDVRGLILAGIVLGAAGAIDDVTVTQASAVWELRAADPDASTTQLFRSGLRIGRDHIASTVNTLLLAYAGAALPLLVLFVLASQSLGAIANSEIVAVEIIRTAVGSIGLVAAVPFTTWLAAATASGEAVPAH
jgi:uncharacterized membrane protein